MSRGEEEERGEEEKKLPSKRNRTDCLGKQEQERFAPLTID
jgi:hypothetical protein